MLKKKAVSKDLFAVTAEDSFFIIKKKTLCGWNFNAQQKRSEVISGGVYCVLHHILDIRFSCPIMGTTGYSFIGFISGYTARQPPPSLPFLA
jgi:hypothetical protein